MSNLPDVVRVAIYTRVSTEEQALHGYSLQTQEESLLQYAKDHNFKVVDVYRDEGHSARQPAMKRAVMQQLLEDVAAGKIDRILFIKLDRWFRNVREYHKIQEVLERSHVTWQATMEDYSTATADGRLKVNIMLSVAENESDRTSERIKFVLDGKRRRKEWCFPGGETHWPYGYRPEIIDGVQRCVKDPATAPYMQAFWDYVVKYNSVRKAGMYIAETYGVYRNYRTWTINAQNELYTGTFKGVEDYCPAYVSRADWERIILNHQIVKKTQRSDRVYLFTGLLRCPLCGNTLKGSYKTYPADRSKEFLSYRCNNSRLRFCEYRHTPSQNKLEKQLLTLVRPQLEAFIQDMDSKNQQKKAQPPAPDVSALNEKLRRLNVMFMSGNLSDGEYLAETKRLKAEIEKAKRADPTPSAKGIQALRDFLASDALDLYGDLPPEEKRRLWRSIIAEVHFDGNNPVKIIPRV